VIAADEVARVKNGTDLVALIRGKGIELRRKGKSWQGPLPLSRRRQDAVAVDCRRARSLEMLRLRRRRRRDPISRATRQAEFP